jgi:hypothetical protein
MTRWIVGLLLLANLALFGWMRWGNLLTGETDTAAMQAALNPDKIKLLSLLSASAPASAPEAASGVPLALSPALSASAPVASAPIPVSAPVPSVAAAAPVAIPLVTKPAAPPKKANCAEWGEFSGEDLVHAQEALATLKLGDSLSQRSVEQDHGYWVYIPPVKKRAQAEKKVAQLKALGIKDYFVMQEKGKWLNTISLGVFKSSEAAQKYLESLRAKGVRSAKLGERKSKLKFTVFMIKDIDAGTQDKLGVLQKSFPDSELKISACGI